MEAIGIKCVVTASYSMSCERHSSDTVGYTYALLSVSTRDSSGLPCRKNNSGRNSPPDTGTE